MLLRLIDKWLKAGVMEDGSVSYPDAGSPQGGVISPLFSNVFLHYVLDLWFEQDVKPRLGKRAFLIRYADDFVIGFCDQCDAQRVMEVLPKRFGKYGLTVHPTKTKLVPFSRRRRRPGRQPDGVAILGRLTCWDSPITGRSLRGYWVVKLKTASRFSRAVRTWTWCRDNRHLRSVSSNKLN